MCPREWALFFGDRTLTERWRGVGRNVSILAVGVTLGLLLSLSWRPSTERNVAPTGEQSDRVWYSIERLEAEQQELKTQLTGLRQELATRQQAVASASDRLYALKAELDRQRLLAGLTPVRGPGVLVTLDDSAMQVLAGADTNTYIIHEYDLRDIVNLLWMAGSEAIAINDERLVNNSSLYCVGSTVMVNNTRLSPPYHIRAIGNARVQQDYLRNPSYLQDLKRKKHQYGLRFEIESVANLTLPAYTGSFLIQHARPGE
jgi:uncharacterized protein YlxW (UPF0749 family)